MTKLLTILRGIFPSDESVAVSLIVWFEIFDQAHNLTNTKYAKLRNVAVVTTFTA